MWKSCELRPCSQDNTEADIVKHGLLSAKEDMKAAYKAHSSDPWKSLGQEDIS